MTVECNPDNVTAELLDTYRAGGVNRVSFGVQSTSAHVLVALGRTHDRANVVRAVELARRAGFDDVQPRPDLRRRGRDARRLVQHARRRPHPRPAAHLRLRADRRSRHAAGRRSRSSSRRRRPGRQVPRRRRAAGRGRPRVLRDLELGQARPRVPPQPPVLDDGGVPGHRLRGPLAPRRPTLLEPAHPRPLPRGRQRGRERGGRRRAPGARRARPRSAAAVPAHDPRRAPRRRSTRTTCPAWSSPTPTIRSASCSRSTAASSPTRWPCACGCRT